MAQAFRHQHRKAPRHQPCRQRAVFGLRHLRTTQDILSGSMRDQRQPKRSVACGAKQHGMRGGVRIVAMAPATAACDWARLPRPARRAAAAPSRSAYIAIPSTTRAKYTLNDCMDLPDADGFAVASRIPAANQIRAHFSVNVTSAKPGLARRASQVLPIIRSSAARRLPVLFRYRRAAKTDAENPQVNP